MTSNTANELLFELDLDGRHHYVYKSMHTTDRRSKHVVSRDEFITTAAYKEILYEAYLNGLTSFRNKGKVVIEISTFNNRRCSILVIINDDSIVIITVFITPHCYGRIHFVTVHNRVYLTYILRKADKSELTSKKIATNLHKDKYILEDADTLFLKAMQKSK